MGRRTKLTKEIQTKICDAIRAGNYHEAACAYAGIGKTTFYRWMEQGEAAKSGIYRDFREAVTRAELQAEARIVAQWQAQIPDDWRAARDFLERRFPSRWGRQERISADLHHRGEVTHHERHEVYIHQEVYDDPESRELAKQLLLRQSRLERGEGDD